MCEYTERIRTLEPILSGRSIYEVFPSFVQTRFPYYSINERQCPVCKRVLSSNECRPPGKATRSLCENCYANCIVNMVNTSCFICGLNLPAQKIDSQKIFPREIGHNIHNRSCLDYFTIIHCIVVEGVGMRFFQNQPALPNLAYKGGLPHIDEGSYLDFDEINAVAVARVKNALIMTSNSHGCNTKKLHRISSQWQVLDCVVIKHISHYSQSFSTSIFQLTCQD